MVEIRTATLADAKAIGPRLNRSLVKSIKTLGETETRPVAKIVRDTFKASHHAWAGIVNGRLVAIWGVMPLSILTGIGYPWLFATDEIRKLPKITLIVAAHEIRKMQALYPRLHGAVDDRFEASVRLARHLGFAVKPTRVMPFSSIEMVSP